MQGLLGESGEGSPEQSSPFCKMHQGLSRRGNPCGTEAMKGGMMTEYWKKSSWWATLAFVADLFATEAEHDQG
jgi:hypothetical protein